MRVVIQGTPDKLYRLSDLSADSSYSHLRYVNADGLDLSGSNLDFTDWVNCSCRNVILPEGVTTWLLSRDTDWSGAKIPSDVSDLNHDLVVEVLRQGAAKSRGRQRRMLLFIADYIALSYRHSWNSVMYRLNNTEGFSVDEMKRFSKDAFTGYPALANRLANEFHNTWTPSRIPIREPFIDLSLPDGRVRLRPADLPVELQGYILARNRYDFARGLETFLSKYEGAPWTVQAFQFDPVPLIMVEPTREPEKSWVS